MLMGRPSTTPTCSSPASSATARPKRGRSPPAGRATSSSTPSTTAACCRFCTSTATRSPTRPSWPASPTKSWMKSYKPEELFDKNGRLLAELAELAPQGTRRMGDNPHANGGRHPHDLRLPHFADYAVDVPTPGATDAEATRVMGEFLRDVIK